MREVVVHGEPLGEMGGWTGEDDLDAHLERPREIHMTSCRFEDQPRPRGTVLLCQHLKCKVSTP